MTERNQHARVGSGTSAAGAFEITPSDSEALPFVTRGIYVGTEGDVRAQLIEGDPVTFVAAPAGQVLPIQAVRVFSTGATATDLVGLD